MPAASKPLIVIVTAPNASLSSTTYSQVKLVAFVALTTVAGLPFTATIGSPSRSSDEEKVIVTVSPVEACAGSTVKPLKTGATPTPVADALFAPGSMGLPTAS